MKLTAEQLKHLDEASRLAKAADKAFREAGLSASTGLVMQIGQALSLARDALQTLTQQAQLSIQK
jgi:hypothetical protein